MKYLDITADVRSARLAKTVRATLLIVGPELPTATRKRLADTTSAVRLLLESNDNRGALIAIEIIEEIVTELPELGRWAERIKALAANLKAVIKVEPND